MLPADQRFDTGNPLGRLTGACALETGASCRDMIWSGARNPTLGFAGRLLLSLAIHAGVSASASVTALRDVLPDAPDLARALREACARGGAGLREIAEAHTWRGAAEELARELGPLVKRMAHADTR